MRTHKTKLFPSRPFLRTMWSNCHHKKTKENCAVTVILTGSSKRWKVRCHNPSIYSDVTLQGPGHFKVSGTSWSPWGSPASNPLNIKLIKFGYFNSWNHKYLFSLVYITLSPWNPEGDFDPPKHIPPLQCLTMRYNSFRPSFFRKCFFPLIIHVRRIENTIKLNLLPQKGKNLQNCRKIR